MKPSKPHNSAKPSPAKNLNNRRVFCTEYPHLYRLLNYFELSKIVGHTDDKVVVKDFLNSIKYNHTKILNKLVAQGEELINLEVFSKETISLFSSIKFDTKEEAKTWLSTVLTLLRNNSKHIF